VLGTAGYMAPERVEGNQATVASDLYALGVVAHECLAGLLPRGGASARTDGTTPDEPVYAPRTPPLPPLPASIPADVAALVSRLTARDPGRRPASAGEVARQAASLRDRYRDAPRPGAVAGAGRELSADDTTWDNPAREGSARDGLAGDATVQDGAIRDGAVRDGAVRDGAAWAAGGWDSAAPDRTAVDGAVRAAGAQTERGRAAAPPPAGTDPRPAGRDGGPGGRRRPRRTVLAIVMAAVIGLALLTFGVLEVLHQRGPAVAAAGPSTASPAARLIDLRESALVGRSLGTVRSQLRHDGLKVRVLFQVSSLAPGDVLRVLPSGRVPAGSVVTVVVAQAPSAARSTVPSRQLPPSDHGGSAPSLKPTPSVSPSTSPDQSPPPSTSPSGSSSPSPSTSPSGSPSPSPSPTDTDTGP
jgi:eukaryotic-like serine/threonine-protein kinase